MREIHVNEIIETVKNLCVDANLYLPKDVSDCIMQKSEEETSALGKHIFDVMKKNIEVAREKQIPICQDTGMVIIFAKVGQDVHITGGNFNDAINEGVRRGYVDGYLRLSIVSDPLIRVNTNDNTPAVIYTELVDGDKIEIVVAPKGFGSENMSALKMFTPSAKNSDIVDFVVDTCIKAGSNPCPPIFVGVGIGGTADKALVLSKEALVLEDTQKNELYYELEREMLDKINASGIGPQGLSGDITALSVKIKPFPTHIAGLPVAVTIGCHVTRHKSAII